VQVKATQAQENTVLMLLLCLGCRFVQMER
jgi:hypothetical protein